MSFAVPFDLALFLLGKFAAAIPVATAAPAPIVIAGKKSKREQSKRKGFLAWIAEMLHHSHGSAGGNRRCNSRGYSNHRAIAAQSNRFC